MSGGNIIERCGHWDGSRRLDSAWQQQYLVEHEHDVLSRRHQCRHVALSALCRADSKSVLLLTHHVYSNVSLIAESWRICFGRLYVRRGYYPRVCGIRQRGTDWHRVTWRNRERQGFRHRPEHSKRTRVFNGYSRETDARQSNNRRRFIDELSAHRNDEHSKQKN